MSLRFQDSHTIPEQTAEVARAVFPRENIYLTLFIPLAACLPIRILLVVSRQWATSTFPCSIDDDSDFTIYEMAVRSPGRRVRWKTLYSLCWLLLILTLASTTQEIHSFLSVLSIINPPKQLLTY